METIKLEVSYKLYAELIWLFKQFNPEDLRIIYGDEKFQKRKKELQETLDYIDSGKADFISLEEFEKRMEKRIKQYEKNL